MGTKLITDQKSKLLFKIFKCTDSPRPIWAVWIYQSLEIIHIKLNSAKDRPHVTSSTPPPSFPLRTVTNYVKVMEHSSMCKSSYWLSFFVLFSKQMGIVFDIVLLFLNIFGKSAPEFIFSTIKINWEKFLLLVWSD